MEIINHLPSDLEFTDEGTEAKEEIKMNDSTNSCIFFPLRFKIYRRSKGVKAGIERNSSPEAGNNCTAAFNWQRKFILFIKRKPALIAL